MAIDEARNARPDRQADPAPTKELTQVSSRTRRPLSEELVNCFSKDDRFIRPARRSCQVHDESERRINRQVSTPIDDEFLRSRVEVAFTERRRVDGVE